MTDFVTRRKFLKRAVAGAAVVSLGSAAPAFLHAAASRRKTDSILVVVEMAGGNDGLNTVIPYEHDVYRKSRPKLAIPAGDILKIGDGLGFHPALSGFSKLLEAGQLAIVQGVGYANPNRSHFESMDIWHTCQRKEEQRTDGWLGRALGALPRESGSDPRGMHFGYDKLPFALVSRSLTVPSVRSLDQFRLNDNGDQQFLQRVRRLATEERADSEGLLGFVQNSTSAALDASQRLEATGKTYQPSLSYPETGLGQKLRSVAQLITSGLSTAVYYVQIDGFDTHSQQPDAHAGLLRQTGDAVAAFTADMIAQGVGDRVLTMCFSEFGRRVSENASEGTDHGTAGPMFFAGTGIRTGLIGSHPDLTKLEDGDLVYHTDFRQVYSAVLEQWLGCESESVLRGRYPAIKLIRGS